MPFKGFDLGPLSAASWSLAVEHLHPLGQLVPNNARPPTSSLFFRFSPFSRQKPQCPLSRARPTTKPPLTGRLSWRAGHEASEGRRNLGRVDSSNYDEDVYGNFHQVRMQRGRGDVLAKWPKIYRGCVDFLMYFGIQGERVQNLVLN